MSLLALYLLTYTPRSNVLQLGEKISEELVNGQACDVYYIDQYYHQPHQLLSTPPDIY